MYVILEKLFYCYIKFMFPSTNLFLPSPLEKEELVSDRPMGKPISYKEWLKQNGE